MSTVEVAVADPLRVTGTVLVVGAFTGGIEGPGTEAVVAALGLDRLPLTPAFRGDIGEHLVLAAPTLRVDAVVFVGLGRMIATNAERLRRAAAVAAGLPAVSGRVVTTLALVHASAEAVGAVTEGFLLGATRARPRKTRDDGERRIEHTTVLVPSGARDSSVRAAQRAMTTAAATIRARELVDAPPNDTPPAALAEQVIAMTASSCQSTVYDRAALVDAGLGGVLRAAQGSIHDPCVVELRYEPADPLGHVVLCGRGTSFDAGGLALRDRQVSAAGKADVAGAVTIAAACSALADLDVRVEVTALLGLTDSMPDGDAGRPGDIVTTRSGRTVEITDSDSDAQLLLADLLDLARSHDPDAIVDVATIGAGAGPLGPYTGAVMGTDDDLVDALLTAAGRAGEALWRLPLPDDLARRLRSDVADVRDTDRDSGADALLAALFLRTVVADVPWAHLDCTGPAWVDPDHVTATHAAGATGYATRTLLTWLEHRTS